jgi:2-keto-4-pentenoate hydratase/2-oxohepta-3-ene-1,7-dioic acid hydratase in catechol pathway
MQFARYLAHGEIAYGVVEEGKVKQLTTTPFEPFRVTDHIHPLEHVKLLAPCTPTKGLAMALNYRSHLRQRPAPSRPEPFYKTPNAFIGPNEPIILPRNAGRVDEEAELVVVMGKRCKGVPPERALEYVLGYTCGVDVSAREWQGGEKADMTWWRAKSSDTFGPLGPFIETDLDLEKFEIICRVNGKEVQHAQAKDLIFNVPTVVSFISQVVTLEPGDVIFTGTAGSTATLKAGDVVEVEIPGIGTLRNPVKGEGAG